VLQASWEDEAAFIHLTENATLRGSVTKSLKLTFLSIVNLVRCCPANQRASLVFHSQSSLPYLSVALLSKKILMKPNVQLIYDMHDLHVRGSNQNLWHKLRYDVFRHYLIAAFEVMVFKTSSIRKMTVSDGLARIVAERYGIKKPTIVRSVLNPKFFPGGEISEDAASEAKFRRVLLYFGQKERAPDRGTVRALLAKGIELHIYGRDITDLARDYNGVSRVPGQLKLFGEYIPHNLNFLQGYSFLFLWHPELNGENYRYSLPNKLFQALAGGLSLIVSKNFLEIIDVLKNLQGSVQVLENLEDLDYALSCLEKSRGNDYKDRARIFLSNLHEEARSAYLSLLNP
jgi:hypothetical protein